MCRIGARPSRCIRRRAGLGAPPGTLKARTSDLANGIGQPGYGPWCVFADPRPNPSLPPLDPCFGPRKRGFRRAGGSSSARLSPWWRQTFAFQSRLAQLAAHSKSPCQHTETAPARTPCRGRLCRNSGCEERFFGGACWIIEVLLPRSVVPRASNSKAEVHSSSKFLEALFR
jgi:hypothetical protein